MAAGNGFLTARPDAVIDGAVEATLSAGYTVAQRFLLDTTGKVNITEIGSWGSDSGENAEFAIFEDDSENTCPGAIVVNSDCTTTYPSVASAFYFTYVTKPVLQGGSYYWLAVLNESASSQHRVTTGGTGVYKSGLTYPTWPTENEWETHTDSASNRMLYAVYEAAAGTAVFARPSSDVAGGTFRSIHTTAPFGPIVIA